MTEKNLIQVGSKTLLVAFVVSVEMVDPESSDFCHFVMVEDAYAMRRSEKAMSDDDIWKVFKALFFGEPVFEWMLEYMSRDLDNWGKFLKLPMSILVNDCLNELNEDVKKWASPVLWFDTW